MNKIQYLLAALILLNMAFIFSNSAAPAEVSNGASMEVAQMVASVAVRGYTDMSDQEKVEAAEAVNLVVRECAHGLEFASLGFLVMLFLQTDPQPGKWGFTYRRRLLLAVFFCLLYAVSDEIHQLYVEGRVCDGIDIAVDTSGAFLGALTAMLPGRGKNRAGG